MLEVYSTSISHFSDLRPVFFVGLFNYYYDYFYREVGHTVADTLKTVLTQREYFRKK